MFSTSPADMAVRLREPAPLPFCSQPKPRGQTKLWDLLCSSSPPLIAQAGSLGFLLCGRIHSPKEHSLSVHTVNYDPKVLPQALLSYMEHWPEPGWSRRKADGSLAE